MIITCGKCGNDVSDKALRCPKCRTPIKPFSMACPECGQDIVEKDLQGDCPHCGYPLRYLRTPSPVQAPVPAPVAPASLECPNCGAVLPPERASDGECPNCGFHMRPSAQPAVAPPQGKPSIAPRRRPLPTYPPLPDAPKEKTPKLPKSFPRKCLDFALWTAIALALLAGVLFIALRYDVGGMRSALRSASNTEETSESLSGELADFRLWVKQVVSVVLDQFPDPPASSGP